MVRCSRLHFFRWLLNMSVVFCRMMPQHFESVLIFPWEQIHCRCQDKFESPLPWPWVKFFLGSSFWRGSECFTVWVVWSRTYFFTPEIYSRSFRRERKRTHRMFLDDIPTGCRFWSQNISIFILISPSAKILNIGKIFRYRQNIQIRISNFPFLFWQNSRKSEKMPWKSSRKIAKFAQKSQN